MIRWINYSPVTPVGDLLWLDQSLSAIDFFFKEFERTFKLTLNRFSLACQNIWHGRSKRRWCKFRRVGHPTLPPVSDLLSFDE